MKKNVRLLLVLLCIMLVAIALWIAAVSLSKEDSESESEPATFTVVKSFDTESINEFSLCGTENENTFSKSDNEPLWVYNGDSDFPLNSEFTDKALETISQISAVSVVEENAADLSKYGLDKPQMKLSVSDQNGKTVFLIGDYNSFSGYNYMCVEGAGDVFQIDETLTELCSKEEKDFIKLDALPEKLSGDSITEVQISNGDKTRTVKDGDNGFEDIKSAVSALKLDNYADYYLSDDEKTEYGFDLPIKVFIKYSESVDSSDTSSSTVTSAVYYDYTLTLGAQKDGYRYFTVQDSNIVYRMEEKKIKALVNTGE